MGQIKSLVSIVLTFNFQCICCQKLPLQTQFQDRKIYTAQFMSVGPHHSTQRYEVFLTASQEVITHWFVKCLLRREAKQFFCPCGLWGGNYKTCFSFCGWNLTYFFLLFLKHWPLFEGIIVKNKTKIRNRK